MQYFKFMEWLLISSFLINSINGANVLAIFPYKVKSHFFFEKAVIKTLISAGHHVTLVTPFKSAISLNNCTVIEIPEETSNSKESLISSDLKNLYWWQYVYLAMEPVQKDCHTIIKLNEIQDMINTKRKPYDVMFLSAGYMYQCYVPIAEMLSVPVIGTRPVRSLYFGDGLIGNPRNPAVFPVEFISNPSTMTFTQRVKNTFTQIADKILFDFYIFFKVKKVTREHFPKFNLEKSQKLSLIFWNGHQSILPRAAVPGSIDIGGIHISDSLNPLPQEIDKFLNEAEHGAILFTFGSITKSHVISEEMRTIFREAFAEIPQRIIWKFEEKINGLSDNVMLSPWILQREILAHQNVKAFITHCGGLGMQEAIYEGKPLVMIPFFGDQPGNAAVMHEHGVGIYLDHRTLTKEKLLSAIRSVINDERYREKMQKLSVAYKDRPMTPQESVVYWTEYVIRHKGAPHLRTAAADMPLYQYLLLDVILFTTAVIAMILIIGYYVIKGIFGSLLRTSKMFLYKNSDGKKSI